MTDFEILKGRPAHCGELVKELDASVLGAIAQLGVEVDEAYISRQIARGCAFHEALRKNMPKGAKKRTLYKAVNAGSKIPRPAKETEWDVGVQNQECHDCDICDKKVVVVKDGMSVVRSIILATHIE